MTDQPLRDLTSEEVETYDRDGVVCARGLGRAHGPRCGCRGRQPQPLRRPGVAEGQGFSGDLFLWKSNDEFRDFVHGSPAARVAAHVLRSKRVNFFYDQLFVKPTGCHVATPWHQDLSFWPIDGKQVCSIWMTFDPVDRDSSGLEFVRGSHRWSRVRFAPRHHAAAVNPRTEARRPARPPAVSAGSARADCQRGRAAGPRPTSAVEAMRKAMGAPKSDGRAS